MSNLREDALYIGVLGHIGSGKGTLCSELPKFLAPEFSSFYIRCSKPLGTELTRRGLPHLREHFAALSKEWGPHKLWEEDLALIPDVARESDVFFFDGIRYQEHADWIGSRRFGLLVATVTDDPMVRYERRRLAAEKIGEDIMSPEDFLRMGRDSLETIIDELTPQVNMIVRNNDGLESFNDGIAAVAQTCRTILRSR